jgi:hypothetical protein
MAAFVEGLTAKVREHETGQAATDVVLGKLVREFRCRDAECDDETSGRKALQRRRHPVQLVRIASRHPAGPMRAQAWRIHVRHLR